MANIDFYTRKEDLSKYVADILEITDEVSILITQIESVLFTQKNQVLGQQNFGINLENLLFTFKKNESELTSEIKNQIYAYCPLAQKYNVDIDVSFKQTDVRDIGLINIYIKDRRPFSILI